MLSFWGKKHEHSFFQEINFFNQIFNQLIMCIWTVRCTTLKNTKKVDICHYLQCVIAIFSLCQYVLQFIVFLQWIVI